MSLLANIVTVLHWIFFVIFPIVGVVYSTRGLLRANPKIQKLFISVLLLTSVSFFVFDGCFLTKLEQALRYQAGELSYSGGLIAHYLKAIGVQVSDDSVFWFLAILILTGILSEIYWNRDKLEKFFIKKEYE